MSGSENSFDTIPLTYILSEGEGKERIIYMACEQTKWDYIPSLKFSFLFMLCLCSVCVVCLCCGLCCFVCVNGNEFQYQKWDYTKKFHHCRKIIYWNEWGMYVFVI
jgi:hypothetical protein